MTSNTFKINRAACNDYRKSLGLESIPLNPEEYTHHYCSDICVDKCPLAKLAKSRPEPAENIFCLFSTKNGKPSYEWVDPTKELVGLVDQLIADYREWQSKYADIGAGDTDVGEAFYEYIQRRAADA